MKGGLLNAKDLPYNDTPRENKIFYLVDFRFERPNEIELFSHSGLSFFERPTKVSAH